MLVNGIECVENTKEEILSTLRGLPNVDAYYSEKYKIILVLYINTQKHVAKIVHIIDENENGKFWANVQAKNSIEEMRTLLTKDMI